MSAEQQQQFNGSARVAYFIHSLAAALTAPSSSCWAALLSEWVRLAVRAAVGATTDQSMMILNIERHEGEGIWAKQATVVRRGRRLRRLSPRRTLRRRVEWQLNIVGGLIGLGEMVLNCSNI